MKKSTFISSGAIVLFISSSLAYGPTGHEIVGGIADNLLANTPTEAKIKTLIDGITLEKASVIPDEIKGWDKKGADDLNQFPHYFDHPKIDNRETAERGAKAGPKRSGHFAALRRFG